jgi:hypothetical protein
MSAEGDLNKSRIISELLRGKTIPRSEMTEYHDKLVSAGFANFQDGRMSQNWKTGDWRPTPAQRYVEEEQIESRFDILDL